MFSFTISGDDDVDVLYDALEGLEELIRVQLQLKQGTIHLVHHQDWFDAFSNSLPQNSLGLHTHTWRIHITTVKM